MLLHTYSSPILPFIFYTMAPYHLSPAELSNLNKYCLPYIATSKNKKKTIRRKAVQELARNAGEEMSNIEKENLKKVHTHIFTTIIQ
jgi:hypothetical protein